MKKKCWKKSHFEALLLFKTQIEDCRQGATGKPIFHSKALELLIIWWAYARLRMFTYLLNSMSKYWIGFFSYLGSRDKNYFFTIELSVVELTRNDRTLVLIYLWGRFSNLGRYTLPILYSLGLSKYSVLDWVSWLYDLQCICFTDLSGFTSRF